MKKDKFITDFEDIPTPRQKMPHLTLEERNLNFKEVELGLEESALKETSRCLSCRRCIGCGLCLAECDQQAIVYDQKEEYTTVQVDSVVVATGTEPFDARRKPEFGYAYYPNVITNIEFERILNANGPFGGIIMRPSDGEIPQSIAFIQCVGSRDEGLGQNYCSNFCCTAALKQAMAAMDKVEELKVTVFYKDIRPFSKNSEHHHLKAKNEYQLNFIQADVNQVIEESDSDNLTIKYSKNGTEKTLDFDLVVLSAGIVPTAGIKRLSRQVGARLNKYGFLPGSDESPIASPGESVWFAGAMTNPTDVSTSLAQASAVAAKVLQSLQKRDLELNGKPNNPIKIKEKNNSNKVGVFFCRYGLNSQLNIDTDDVIRSMEKADDNLYIGDLEYGCNTTGKHAIIEAIEKEKLGRIIIVPCYSQKAHTVMFQQLIQSVGLKGDGLSILSFETHDENLNTEDVKQKIIELIKLEAPVESFEEEAIQLIKETAIVGDSSVALQSAIDIAEQGFKVHLLAFGKEIGPGDQQIFWHIENVKDIMNNLIQIVTNHSNIQIYQKCQVTKLEGKPGHYMLIFNENGNQKSIKIGAVVIATQANPYLPSEFSYNNHRNVITQSELNQLISAKDFSSQKIAMIQCVGSRNPDHPYCSQFCCEQAIKNALKIKEIQSEAEIHILHRDIRVFDFEEDNYTEAVEKDVHFIRMDKTPEIKSINGKFEINVTDRSSDQNLKLQVELVVLSSGILPDSKNQEIAHALNIELDNDGFFSEGNNMLKPLQSNQQGIFFAGTSHSPQSLKNALMQASAVAGRIGVMFRR